MFRSWRYGFWAAGAVLWWEPRPAQAAAQEEWQLGLHLMGAMLTAPSEASLGAGGGLDVQYGLTDAWALRAALDGAHVVGATSGDASRSVAHMTAGVAYTWDVLRLLPVAEASIGAARISGDSTAAQINLGGQIGLGADYLLDRRWSLGFVGRLLYLPLAISAGDGALLAETALRVLYRLN